MFSTEINKERVNQAQEVINWSLFSDKTSDKKPSDMSVEEAEQIIFNSKELAD